MSQPSATTLRPSIPLGWNVSVFGDEVSEDFEEQCAEISRSGLTHLELRGAFGKNVLQLTDPELRKIEQCLDRHGIAISGIASPVNKLPYTLDGRQQELEKLRGVARIATALGVRNIRIFTPFITGTGPGFEQVSEWLRDQIRVAREHDLVLLVENDGAAWAAYPDNARHMFDTFGGPHFKAVLDFANAVSNDYDPLAEWLPWLLPHLASLHIKDIAKGGAEALPAGKGDGQIAPSLKWLVQRGWRGSLILEPHLQHLGLSGVDAYRLALAGLNECLPAQR